ncbi:MAG: hypothetical protein IIV23_04130 [Ruminococcus sp.]|nr:hypothetical protein [Ruminococcus sp.]
MTTIAYTLAVFIYALGVAIIALFWVLSMKRTYESSAREDAERIAEQRFRVMCENTEYHVQYAQYILCGKGYTADKHPEIAQSFVPVPGRLYVNRNGHCYKCLRLTADGDPVMMQMDTGWLLTATGCRVYTDGQIEWDSSYDCRFGGAVC